MVRTISRTPTLWMALTDAPATDRGTTPDAYPYSFSNDPERPKDIK